MEKVKGEKYIYIHYGENETVHGIDYRDSCYYFSDETSNFNGPYYTLENCKEALESYIENL
jgi:phosphoserine aminotransferase